MYDLHTHTLMSDGELLPTELIRRASVLGYTIIGITDHGDASNIDTLIRATQKVRSSAEAYGVRLLTGVEITHVPPVEIADLAAQAKAAGADIVIVHDPQPAALIPHFPDRRAKWVWRCHIDASRPFRPVWKYLREFVHRYDASIFSLAAFARRLPHPVYLIAPSIDPLHEKNVELDQGEIEATYSQFQVDPKRPIILQVSRFDRFKDPLGVIQSYKTAKHFLPSLQLILAGGEASDDPEGEVVLDEVRVASGDDPDIKVLLLPGDAHRTINALQRCADIVLQKSLREGFGLTVTEAMWKRKPVIGGDTGGIRIQVINHHTGFTVNSPEGAALRIRYLLQNRDILTQMGEKAREFVRENFLITRHLREYLTLFFVLLYGDQERIEL